MTPRHAAPARSAAWTKVAAAAAVTAVGVLMPGASAAAADSDTGIDYPAGASATRFTGKAFDACDAPAVATMKAWRKSPYGAVAIYTSGGLRACAQRQLTHEWVQDVSAMGWRLIPIDVGLQAPCAYNERLGAMSSDPATARAQGATAATGALAAAATLGLLPGSALYSDLEPFRYSDAACVEAVRGYLSGWTAGLHAKGYLAGAYGDTSLVRTQAASYESPDHARLDAVWSARWNGDPTTSGWSDAPDTRWPAHQRLKQFQGDHDEVHGGALINIDSNVVDAPVATVAQPRVAPELAIPRAEPDPFALAGVPLTPGATVQLVCRTGSPTGYWSKLTDGSYLPLRATPKAMAKSLPVCTTPFQVTDAKAPARSGPAPGAEVIDRLPQGLLTWPTCETPGTTRGRPGYWLRMDTGDWISGPLTAKPDPYARHAALPACSQQVVALAQDAAAG